MFRRKRSALAQSSVTSRDAGYELRLKEAKADLQANLAWTDIVLPYLEEQRKLLADEVLENDSLTDEDRNVKRKTRTAIGEIRGALLRKLRAPKP